MKYFDQLNYVLGNEDNSLEYGILRKDVNHVTSIAGSGSRIISLLAQSPKNLTCIDISKPQLYVTQLRIATLRILSYQEFLAFWGYPTTEITPLTRKNIFEKLALTKEARIYLETLFEANKWQAILYVGSWEKTFGKISQLLSFIIGHDAKKLLSHTNPEEYKSYLTNQFPRKKWSFAVWILGNSLVFNALLYKGNFPKKNIPKSIYKFYIHNFDRLFQKGPARHNHLLQMVFLGKIKYAEGLPFDCTPLIYEQAKKGVNQCNISFVHGDLVNEIIKLKDQIDYLCLSDVPSYFEKNLEQNFMQTIRANLSHKSLVVIRYYLRIPQNLNLQGYNDVTQEYQGLIEEEKTQMYSIQILEKS